MEIRHKDPTLFIQSK
uniref:Uncharacterized protein n=1 Tax=Arundo donax TaxID=35708 RepID=A0A0A9AKC6_ARUDO